MKAIGSVHVDRTVLCLELRASRPRTVAELASCIGSHPRTVRRTLDRLVDLMRRRPDAPYGVMEALLTRSIEYAPRLGVVEVSLGLVPIAIDPRVRQTAADRLMRAVFWSLGRFQRGRSLSKRVRSVLGGAIPCHPISARPSRSARRAREGAPSSQHHAANWHRCPDAAQPAESGRTARMMIEGLRTFPQIEVSRDCLCARPTTLRGPAQLRAGRQRQH
jgi:hypothetical protein